MNWSKRRHETYKVCNFLKARYYFVKFKPLENYPPYSMYFSSLNSVKFLFPFRTSPVGIASIIAGKLLEVDSLTELVEQLGLYMVCVIVGLIIHSCITLPIMYTVLTCSNPLKLVRGCLQALLVAFGTSSR